MHSSQITVSHHSCALTPHRHCCTTGMLLHNVNLLLHMQAILDMQHFVDFELAVINLNKSIGGQSKLTSLTKAQQTLSIDMLQDVRNEHLQYCNTNMTLKRGKRQLMAIAAISLTILGAFNSFISLFAPNTILPQNRQCPHFKRIVDNLNKNQRFLSSEIRNIGTTSSYNIRLIDLAQHKAKLLDVLHQFQTPNANSKITHQMTQRLLKEALNLGDSFSLAQHHTEQLISFGVNIHYENDEKLCSQTKLAIIAELKVPGNKSYTMTHKNVAENNDGCLLFDSNNMVKLESKHLVMNYPVLRLEEPDKTCTAQNIFLCQNRFMKATKCVPQDDIVIILKEYVFIKVPATLIITDQNNGKTFHQYNDSITFTPRISFLYHIHTANTDNVFVIDRIVSEMLTSTVTALTLQNHLNEDFIIHNTTLPAEINTDFTLPEWGGYGINAVGMLNLALIILNVCGLLIFWHKFKGKNTKNKKGYKNREHQVDPKIIYLLSVNHQKKIVIESGTSVLRCYTTIVYISYLLVTRRPTDSGYGHGISDPTQHTKR